RAMISWPSTTWRYGSSPISSSSYASTRANSDCQKRPSPPRPFACVLRGRRRSQAGPLGQGSVQLDQQLPAHLAAGVQIVVVQEVTRDGDAFRFDQSYDVFLQIPSYVAKAGEADFHAFDIQVGRCHFLPGTTDHGIGSSSGELPLDPRP